MSIIFIMSFLYFIHSYYINYLILIKQNKKYKIKNKMSMKRSLTPKKSTQNYGKNSGIKQSSNRKQNQSSLKNSNLYFCHFKNAMYMGGVKTFQKNGRGLLLHDNGTNLVSSYYNDLLHGHNIFFSNCRLLSTQYSKNKLMQAVYRTDGFLLATTYNNDGQLDGKTILLNYANKSIIYCTFKKGMMVTKQIESDFTLLNRIFQLNELQFLLAKKHCQCLQYNFPSQSPLTLQRCGNKLTIGYEKNGLVNGLAFSYFIKSIGRKDTNAVDTLRSQDTFQLIEAERGYYVNGQLNGFGEKVFKNGNSYIGQFKYDLFQGHGVLKNTIKKNWVNGLFQRGNLVDLIQYNHQNGQKNYDKIIQSFHQKRSNWINNQVSLVSWDSFDIQIQKILNTQPQTQIKSLQQRKQQVLKKIQQNFICETNISSDYSSRFKQSSFSGIINKNKSQQDSIQKFVRNFIPEGQNITTQKYSPRQRDRQTPRQRKSSPMNNGEDRHISIRKSRIFQKSQVKPSKSVDSFLKLQRFPQRNEENQPSLIKNRSSSFASPSKLQQTISMKKFRGQNSRYQQNSSRFQETNSRMTQNSGSPRQINLKQSDIKQRQIGKSRIFSYLNSQQEDITPKFHYNQRQSKLNKNDQSN